MRHCYRSAYLAITGGFRSPSQNEVLSEGTHKRDSNDLLHQRFWVR